MSKMLGIAMAISFLGCAQPITVGVSCEIGVVQFGPVSAEVEQSQSLARGLASTGATSVVFSVTTAAGTPVETNRKLNLVNFNGNLLSENLVLSVGSYRLTSFQLLDEDDNVIYVTPLLSTPVSKFRFSPAAKFRFL